MEHEGEQEAEARRAGLSRRDRGIAAAVAGALGLAVSEAMARLLGTQGPAVAVASAVRDLTPGSLATTLVHLVQSWDKPLLLGGTVVLFLLLCAAAGALTTRRPVLMGVAYAVLALLGLIALVRVDSWPLSLLLTVVGWAVWVTVFSLLNRSAPNGADRRRFLLAAGAGGVAAIAIAIAGRAWTGSADRVERARRLLRLPIDPGTEPPGSSLGVLGAEPWRTPNEDFYTIATTLSPPSIEPEEWSLRIHGMVDREFRLSYQDLIRMPITHSWMTLACVSNEVGGDLVGNAHWSGVLVRDVLAEVGVHADADAVLQTSKDGWTCGTPLAALLDERPAMLAIGMNGLPLPVEHGFPVRMVVPGLYGYVSATKWLVDLEVTRFDRIEAYWTQRGWSEKGPVKTQSRIDVPTDGESVSVGRLRIGGVAWSPHTGIREVEFQLDGGEWRPAELGAVAGADTWVQWAAAVHVDEGSHRLVVRATDEDGNTQTSVQHDVVPNGATGWHEIGFEAR